MPSFRWRLPSPVRVSAWMKSAGAIPSVRDLLWETALRIEQGDVPFAERRLEEARQRLMEALQRGAGQAEIERLMNELQEALDRYLARPPPNWRAAATPRCRSTANSPRMLRSDDLKDLIEMARQLSRTGGRESGDADAGAVAARARQHPLRPEVAECGPGTRGSAEADEVVARSGRSPAAAARAELSAATRVRWRARNADHATDKASANAGRRRQPRAPTAAPANSGNCGGSWAN